MTSEETWEVPQKSSKEVKMLTSNAVDVQYLCVSHLGIQLALHQKY